LSSVLVRALLCEAIDLRAGQRSARCRLRAGAAREQSGRGYRKVIDISADSANGWGGIPIAEARRTALSADIVINGPAILCRTSDCSGRPNAYDLEAAFAKTIIGGPASFVIRADGGSRFAEAVRRKLVLEIAGTPDPGPDGVRVADRTEYSTGR
jgi:hypothetical protein